MVISTTLGYLGSQISSYFLNKKKKIHCIAQSIKWYLPYSLYKICIPLHCNWSDKAAMSPKRKLNADLSYLPSVQNFFVDFRKQESVSNLRLDRFLYRVSLTGKFQPNQFLINRFLVTGKRMFYRWLYYQVVPLLASNLRRPFAPLVSLYQVYFSPSKEIFILKLQKIQQCSKVGYQPLFLGKTRASSQT